MTTFDISVILAEAPGRPDLEPSLASIERACAGIAAEVLVVRPAGRRPLRSSALVTIRELAAADGLLVPESWGIGVRAAKAPVFGCLTSEFTLHDDWAHVLMRVLMQTDAPAASGTIALARHARTTTVATYLTRFSAFLPGSGTEPTAAGNIPGDTAVYRRDRVLEHADLLGDGFWEIEFHRRFAAAGSNLMLVPAALATFDSNRNLFAIAMLRFRHAREFGVTRVVRHGHNRLRLFFAAPLVPIVLVARIWRRASGHPGAHWLVVRALPALVFINAAWAAGEAAGARSARGRS